MQRGRRVFVRSFSALLENEVEKGRKYRGAIQKIQLYSNRPITDLKLVV
jgi:hypothetical protein